MRKAAVLFSDNTVRSLSEVKKDDLFIAWEEPIDDGETYEPGYSIIDEDGKNLFLATSDPYVDEFTGDTLIEVESMDVC